MTLPVSSFLYLNHKPILGDFELQSPDITVAEKLHFLFRSRYACFLIDLLRKFHWVLPDKTWQMLFKLGKEDGFLHFIRACGTEIIYGTVIDAVLCESRLDGSAAVFVFIHDKKVGFGQTFNQPPKV